MQVKPRLTDVLGLGCLDALQFDDDFGARARWVGAVVIDRPVGLAVEHQQQIPVGWEKMVVRKHGTGLEVIEHRVFGLAMKLSHGALVSIA